MPKTKSQIRMAVLIARQRLDSDEYKQMSDKLAEKFLALPEYKMAKKIGLYAGKSDEPMTDAVIKQALHDKKTVALPKVRWLEHLDWHVIKSLSNLELSHFGIREPRGGLPPVAISKLDLILVPGVVFDRQGNRIGYGRGFYDQALKGYFGLTVSLAFPCQLVDQVPTDEWDKKINKIITI